MSEHTPEPWAAIWSGRYIVPASHASRSPGGSIDDIRDRDHYAQCICRLSDDRHGRGTADANAAFIVRACNSFDDLTLSLAWLYGLLENKPSDFNEQLPLALGAARAALTKAGKEHTP